ncbi:MAG: 16S rRNA processing protein RimM [Clostridia bacterium]|nr:16S rRNA processing protein RimM [Clostridia bacterium]
MTLRVSLGRIVAPHGLRGEVRVALESDFPERLPGRAVVVARDGDDPGWPTAVLAARPARGGLWLVRLRGLESRSAAEALRGRSLWVEAASLPPLPAGRWYVHEVVGLKALDEGGRELGQVAEVVSTPANDVYVVRGPFGEVLVPAVRSIVLAVEPALGRIRLRLPRGLLPGEGEDA